MKNNMKELVNSNEVENVICSEVTNNEAKNIMEKDIPEILKLIKTLQDNETMCCGLAGIQVGISKKFFVHNLNSEPEVYFNCIYFSKDMNKVDSNEGCFSYEKGKKHTTVKRYKKIIVKGQVWNSYTNKLESFTKKVLGFDAFVYQHEIDHHGNGSNIISKTIFTNIEGEGK